MSGIDASGIITNYHLSSPVNVWYETASVDEIIPFVDSSDARLQLINDIQVFASTTDILYKLCKIDNKTDKNILYDSDTMFVENGAIDATEGVSFNAIQILGIAGQVFRFKGNWY